MVEKVNLDVLQNTLLDALIEFKKICDSENIKFFLRGGSVMGAVKYNGFVPWDDDIDIAVPRKDYNKIIEILNKKVIENKYVVINSKYQPELHCYFPRMFLLEEERQKLKLPRNTHLGLHLIDILPLDGAPNNIIVRNFYFIKVYMLRYLASLGTNYVDEHVDMHSTKQKILIKIGKSLGLNLLFPQNKVFKMLDKLYSKYDWEKQDYCGTITASKFKKEVMPTKIWGKGVEFFFEGNKFLVPEQYDEYLKIMYGPNYMFEEPVEKRTHHS